MYICVKYVHTYVSSMYIRMFHMCTYVSCMDVCVLSVHMCNVCTYVSCLYICFMCVRMCHVWTYVSCLYICVMCVRVQFALLHTDIATIMHKCSMPNCSHAGFLHYCRMSTIITNVSAEVYVYILFLISPCIVIQASGTA